MPDALDMNFTPNERPISTEEFAQRWRAEATGIKGLKSIRFRANSGGPGGNQDAFSVDLHIVIWMYSSCQPRVG